MKTFTRCRTFGCALALALLLATAQPLPAPISEIETPTATPKQLAKPKPKYTPKPKPSALPKSSVSQQTAKQTHFAGTWAGTMPAEGLPGYKKTRLTIDPTETTMLLSADFIGKARFGPVKTVRDGDTLRATFMIGLLGSTYSVTPEPDGKTARVRLQWLGTDHTAVFDRVDE